MIMRMVFKIILVLFGVAVGTGAALAQPALPPPAAPPSPEALAEFAKIAASCGIDLCGPPLQ